jgi:hypothetical protein
LGFIINIREGVVRVTERKIERILEAGQILLSKRERVKVCDVASFTGLIISVGRAVRLVCWFTRALYSLIGITVFMGDAVRIP